MFTLRTIGLQNIRYVKTRGWFITRLPVKGDLPKNIKWVKELSPSLDLLMEYKNNQITKDKFKEKFMLETKTEIYQNKLKELIETIIDIIQNDEIKEKEIYLICYETSANNCHRRWVAEEVTKKLLEEKIEIDIHHMG